MNDTQNTYYIDPTIYDGRPQNPEGRLEKELRTYDLLDRLGVSYKRLDHDAMPTIEACHDVDKLLGIEICKNLFLRNAQKTAFYLLLLPGTKKFKTAALSKQIGSARLSFAEPEFMEEFLDITPGAVSVMGLMNDTKKRVQLVIDQEVLEHTEVACHPCVNTTSIKLSVRDLLGKFLPAVGHEAVCVKL